MLKENDAAALQTVLDYQNRLPNVRPRGCDVATFSELMWPGAKKKRAQAGGMLARLYRTGLLFTNRGGNFQVSAQGRAELKAYRWAQVEARNKAQSPQ